MNPIYSGKQIWNRVRMVKNPSTGKRLCRVNPPSEWHTVEVPHLRIVDQPMFDRVAERLDAAGSAQRKHAPRSKRILSGLLRCGCCNGGMTIIGSDPIGPRVQCSVHAESEACENSARYYIQKIEKLVVDA